MNLHAPLAFVAPPPGLAAPNDDQYLVLSGDGVMYECRRIDRTKTAVIADIISAEFDYNGRVDIGEVWQISPDGVWRQAVDDIAEAVLDHLLNDVRQVRFALCEWLDDHLGVNASWRVRLDEDREVV